MTSDPGREAELLGRLDPRIQALLAGAPIIFFAFDREGIVTFTAGKGLQAIGRQPGGAVGRSVFELYRDYPWVLRAIQRALAGEAASVTGEIRGTWFEIHYVPVLRPDGTPDGVVGIASDITQFKRTEAERNRLLAEEQSDRRAAERTEAQARGLADRLRSLADVSLAFAEASVDFKAVVEVVVRRVGALMGDACLLRLVSEDGQKLLPVAYFHPNEERMKQLRQSMEHSIQRVDEGVTAAVLRTGEALLFPVITPEMVHARMKREFWPYLETVSSALVVPIRTGMRIAGIMTLLRDPPGPPYTTDDQAFLQALAARAAQALEVSHLFREAQEAIHARDEFLSIASHELRTPLTASLIQLQVLRRYQDSPEKLALLLSAGLSALETQLSRLVRLTDELLDVSRLRLGQLELHREDVELVEIVREVVAQQEAAIARSGSRVTIRDALPIVGDWDRVRLEQLVTSLLTNALKFGEGRPVDVEVSSTGDRARLVVRDRGMGIPLPLQSRIFDRFERAVSLHHFGGLGLGLYVARQIVEAHGGTIRVESTPGKGATFTVELPLQATQATAMSPAAVLSHEAEQAVEIDRLLQDTAGLGH